ncbi:MULTISPECIES: helix-turn-helix domain-containing protein [Bacillus cereus group]|uniref:Helix-turn-helix domain-containing protein n=1 Tax=Bacillus cereus TaxID=1396 RepID=A0A9W7UZG0_BACCE|nr:helix-turn-helix domain-containing protein [Bacillus cereus]KAB2400734.1 helix-turn-helix domain-containing protein [Bacillus cereus]KAB2410940.1 helix-turn-helix domain-containing protein [Bacillus cereus]KAB2431057.1 helix-turn-helix domain-containing protein [Bacillus cereus]
MATYHFNSKDELMKFMENDVLTVTEASEIMGFSRQRFNKLVSDGRLTPIKKAKGTKSPNLFLRSDVEQMHQELKVLRDKYRPYEEKGAK